MVIIGFLCLMGCFLTRGLWRVDIFLILGLILLISSISFSGIGVTLLSREDQPGYTEYYISSGKIIKIRYISENPLSRYYSKDEVLSISPNRIGRIVFKPWKKDDSHFMHISFHAKNYGIGSSELIHGDLVTKGTWKKKIEFQNIRNWKKVREILTELIPNMIIDYKF